MGRVLAILFACPLAPAAASAQTFAADADTAVEYFTRGPGPLARLGLVPWADVRLRHDMVHQRPGAPDFNRQRVTLRGGLAWERPLQPLRAEAGVRASLGSDHNHETWSPFDNETADTLELDRLGLRITSATGQQVGLGKMRLPFPLTGLVWDEDLRPVGIMMSSRFAWTEGLSMGAGAFARGRFDVDDVRLVVAQLGLERGNPALSGGELRATYLDVGNTEAIVRQGLTRQNRAAPGASEPAAEFRVVDVQLAAHRHTLSGWRMTGRLEAAFNLSSVTEREAFRIRLAAGGPGAPWGIEAGWIYQRIAREAVAGALNSDDWWFHSRARGHSLFVNAGLGRPISGSLAFFAERRDDVAAWTQRWVADLRWHWGD